MKLVSQILPAISLFFFVACSSGKKETLPAPPSGTAQVKDLLKGKQLSTEKTGFYANVTINDKPTMEWIDVATEKGEYEKQIAEELKQFSLNFVNDTAVTVGSKGKSYNGTYVVDDTVGEYDKEQEGVKLRITYSDPEMKFGGLEAPQEITYTYLVKGIADKKILLQFPREVNRRPVMGLMTMGK